MTTAAVPQAKTSLISPLVTPSRHSSMEILRSSTWCPIFPASSMMLDAGDALEDRAERGGHDAPVAYTKYMFMPPSSST